jgi:hypothetical protein
VDYDLALVGGLLLALLSVPAMISAFSGGRSPRLAIVLAVAGGGLFLFAMTMSPIAYRAEDIPQAALRVIAQIMGR